MKGYEKYIEDLTHNLPEVCRPKDLVEAKIFNSTSEISHYRKQGLLPPYIQLREGGRLLFSKMDIIEWLKSKVCNGNGKSS